MVIIWFHFLVEVFLTVFGSPFLHKTISCTRKDRGDENKNVESVQPHPQATPRFYNRDNTAFSKSDSVLYYTNLLFKVAPLLLINKHQVEVVADTELFVDVSHRGRQVVASQEQTNGNRLT